MNFFVATIGELVIVELCVLWIWFQVLLDAVRNRTETLAHRRLLLTSLGLVFNAVAITGIMAFRIVEYVTNFWPFVPGIVGCYVMLAIGNIMFIISASLGTNVKVLKTFIVLTGLWTVFCFAAWYYEWSLPYV